MFVFLIHVPDIGSVLAQPPVRPHRLHISLNKNMFEEKKKFEFIFSINLNVFLSESLHTDEDVQSMPAPIYAY